MTNNMYCWGAGEMVTEDKLLHNLKQIHDDRRVFDRLRTHFRQLILGELLSGPGARGPSAVSIRSRAIGSLFVEWLLWHECHYTLCMLTSEMPSIADLPEIVSKEPKKRQNPEHVKEILTSLQIYDDETGELYQKSADTLISCIFRAAESWKERLKFCSISNHHDNCEGSPPKWASKLREVLSATGVGPHILPQLQASLSRMFSKLIQDAIEKEREAFQSELIRRERKFQVHMKSQEDKINCRLKEIETVLNGAGEFSDKRRDLVKLLAEVKDQHETVIYGLEALEEQEFELERSMKNWKVEMAEEKKRLEAYAEKLDKKAGELNEEKRKLEWEKSQKRQWTVEQSMQTSFRPRDIPVEDEPLTVLFQAPTSPRKESQTPYARTRDDPEVRSISDIPQEPVTHKKPTTGPLYPHPIMHTPQPTNEIIMPASYTPRAKLLPYPAPTLETPKLLTEILPYSSLAEGEIQGHKENSPRNQEIGTQPTATVSPSLLKPIPDKPTLDPDPVKGSDFFKCSLKSSSIPVLNVSYKQNTFVKELRSSRSRSPILSPSLSESSSTKDDVIDFRKLRRLREEGRKGREEFEAYRLALDDDQSDSADERSSHKVISYLKYLRTRPYDINQRSRPQVFCPNRHEGTHSGANQLQTSETFQNNSSPLLMFGQGDEPKTPRPTQANRQLSEIPILQKNHRPSFLERIINRGDEVKVRRQNPPVDMRRIEQIMQSVRTADAAFNERNVTSGEGSEKVVDAATASKTINTDRSNLQQKGCSEKVVIRSKSPKIKKELTVSKPDNITVLSQSNLTAAPETKDTTNKDDLEAACTKVPPLFQQLAISDESNISEGQVVSTGQVSESTDEIWG